MSTNHRAMQHQYSRHLAGALQTDKIDFYRLYPSYVQKRFPTLRSEWFREIRNGRVGNILVLPWLEKHMKYSRHGHDDNIERVWSVMWEVIYESLSIQIKHITQGLTHADTDQSLSVLPLLYRSQELKESAQEKIFIINVHNDIIHKSEQKARSFFLDRPSDIELVGDLVVLHSFPKGPLIITYQMFVSVLDKIEARLSWLFYVLYTDNVSTRAPFKTGELFARIYTICESAYQHLGNEAARLFKSLEPMCVGSVLRLYDPATNDHSFLTEILASLLEKGEPLHGFALRIASVFKDYLEKYGKEGAPYVIEQYGQEKLHHYPITSGELGMLKMYQYGTAFRPNNDQAVRDLAADFKREYMVAYFEKHRVLPKVLTGLRLDARIAAMYKDGRPQSLRECWKIPKAAWGELEYKQNHSFNYFPQISDLLDDKAITPDLHHIWQLFAADALDVIGQTKPRSRQHTRLILEILHRKEINIKDFYDQVEKLGYVPRHWAVIQLMAKERELKVEARVFSILTFECRMMASACERNLGEQILPLFKQQSMTLSGAQLKQKMDVLSTLPETDTSIWVRFNMDLTQWNYTFRTFQQSYILDSLCSLFGVHHFRYMPQIFTDSLLISANKFTPPGFPNTFTHWDCHAGGNQGILQKLWTLITILIIRKVMYTLDLDHRLTGSGDNQVLFVKLAKADTIKQTITMIKNRLSEAFDDVGLALKLEETWHSSNLTCYQRTYYLDGAKVINGLKQSGRAFSGSGDINAGINATVTTAVNGGVGLTEYQSDPVLGPAFTLLEVLITLLGDINYRTVVPQDVKRLIVLTFLSSDFGFLPMQQLTSFLYAGHQDTLSESLSLLKYIWDEHKAFRPYVSGVVKFVKGGTDPESMLQLILEPTALNISRPRLPEALVRDKVEEFLTNPTAVSNQQLKLMFLASQKPDQLKLAQELLKIRPINTSLVHSLFEYSHIGSLLGTLSRFNRISSIVKLVGMNQGTKDSPCFSQLVRELDMRNLKYFFSRIKVTSWNHENFVEEVVRNVPRIYYNYCMIHQLATDCVFSLRVFLISYTYNLPNEFITGPYTPPPTEQLILTDKTDHILGPSDLIISPSYNIPDTLAGIEGGRGCYSLYIGSRTADPVRSIKLTALEGVEVGTAIKTLLKTLAWIKSTNSDATVGDFIKEQLGARMVGLEELLDQLVPGTAGGNINHRFGGPGAIMWAFSNSTTLISTWYMITSNRAEALQRGEEDRFVFFQQLFHHIYGVLRFCRPYKRKIFATIRLDHCSYLIPEAKYSSPPIHVPGKDKLFGGLILDDVRKDQLMSEAEHFTQVMSRSILNQLTGDEVLTGVLGHEVASSVVQHSIGGANLSQEDHMIPSAGTDINLTLLRKVPLNQLLISVAIHLALFNQFGPKLTPMRLRRVLSRRSSLGLMGQSATPLVNFLNALITSGKINQILQLGGTWWDWDGSRSVISLMSPLLKAMSRCLMEWMEEPFKVAILTEIKALGHSYKGLLRFLRNWSPKLARTLDQNKFLDPVNQLFMVNQMRYPLKVLMVTDIGIATEFGRRIHASDPVAVHTNTENLERPLLEPAFSLVNDPNWFSVDLGPGVVLNDGEGSLDDQILEEYHKIKISKNLTRLMRWNSGPSIGSPKIASILESEGLELSSEDIVMTLAEGLGSYLSYILHRYPAVSGIYNSKILPDDTPTALAGLYVPPCLLCPCDCLQRVVNLPESWSEYGDLKALKTWSELDHALITSNKKLRLLILDMDYQEDASEIVLKNLVSFIQDHKPQMCIVKLSYAEIMSDCLGQLVVVCGMFSKNKLVKPVYSNPGSPEVFLLCSQPTHVPTACNVEIRAGLLWGLRWMSANFTAERRGQSLVDAMQASWDTKYCPGFLTIAMREEREERGIIYTLLGPYLTQLFDITYRRYYRRWDLSTSEQIVTRSTSTQSSSTDYNTWTILTAVNLYLQVFGGQLGFTGIRASKRAVQLNPDPLLEVLDDVEKSAPHPKAWKQVVRTLSAMILGVSPLQTDLDIIMIEWCLQLLVHNDKFGLVTESQQQSAIQSLKLIKPVSKWAAYDWLTGLLDPGKFLLVDLMFMRVSKELGWSSVSIRCSLPAFDNIIQELPWQTRIIGKGDPRVMVVSAPYEEIETMTSQRELLFVYLDFAGVESRGEMGLWKRAKKPEGVSCPFHLWYYLVPQ
ncbi:MAG: RNA-dependent RNA polymerase [Bat faecal associated arto-like virus 2]|nr:MAG: RNA-dependent RNA polymerase [Bat faecal associated arto-like virus 2]